MVRDFKKEDWVMERVSDWRKFDNYRNIKTNEVIECITFDKMVKAHESYLYDYELLRSFRLEHLPFGKYPEVVLQAFLNKRYDKDNT